VALQASSHSRYDTDSQSRQAPGFSERGLSVEADLTARILKAAFESAWRFSSPPILGSRHGHFKQATAAIRAAKGSRRQTL